MDPLVTWMAILFVATFGLLYLNLRLDNAKQGARRDAGKIATLLGGAFSFTGTVILAIILAAVNFAPEGWIVQQ